MRLPSPLPFSRRAVAGALVLACALPALPQDRVARIVVGAAAGASSDAVARLLADSFGRSLGRTFIVDNKPGASGNIAAEMVARAGPDGSHLLLVYNAHPAVGALFPKLPFDPVRDLRSVGMVGTTPYVLAAHPQVPGRDLAEMLALAKAAHRPLSFGTTGAGSPQHLTMERLKNEAGVDITMVHYKGGAPAQNDVIAGHVDLLLATPSLALAQVKAGKLKPVAVTSAQRLPELPDVPTITEAGVRDFVSVGWFALLLPAAAPEATVRLYNEALNQALANSPVKERLQAQGITPAPGTPQELDRRMQSEGQVWARLIKALDIKPD